MKPTTDLVHDVAAFQEKFGRPFPLHPRPLTGDHRTQAFAHLQEELTEYMLTADEDLEGKFDALIDLIYVALGCAHNHGFPFKAGWARVHAANMTKVRPIAGASDLKGRPASVDIVKPEGFIPPALSDLVNQTEAA